MTASSWRCLPAAVVVRPGRDGTTADRDAPCRVGAVSGVRGVRGRPALSIAGGAVAYVLVSAVAPLGAEGQPAPERQRMRSPDLLREGLRCPGRHRDRYRWGAPAGTEPSEWAMGGLRRSHEHSPYRPGQRVARAARSKGTTHDRPAPTVAPRRHRPGDRGLPRVARDRARRHALRRRPADPGPQDVDLGVVALGAVIDVPFSFLNHCTNGSHLDADQVVSFTFAGGTAPDGGNILGGSDGSVGRRPPAGLAMASRPNTTMYLTGTAGMGHDPGSGGRGRLRVPHLVGQARRPRASRRQPRHPRPARPDDPPRGRREHGTGRPRRTSSPSRGNTTGGRAIDWSGIASACSTPRTALLPVSCSFNAPSVLSVGSWTILCSATDSLGAVGHDAFALNVLDTTAPAIAGHAPVDVTTADAGGAIAPTTRPRLTSSI